MLKTAAFSLVFLLALGTSAAHAAAIVDFSGTATGSAATGTATITLAADGSSFTGEITNTAPFDARITAFGFALPSNLTGYAGVPATIDEPGAVEFDFEVGLDHVPQYEDVVLDFGYITGRNDFSGGHPNDGLPTGQTLYFTVTGPFEGITDAEIAAGLYVRFQRVNSNIQTSDVAIVGGTPTVVPEPASMLLFGTGLVYLARRRMRRDHA